MKTDTVIGTINGTKRVTCPTRNTSSMSGTTANTPKCKQFRSSPDAERGGAAPQPGGFIATSSITFGRISRSTPRNVASSEAVAAATSRREPRRRTRAVARPSRPGRIVANTSAGSTRRSSALQRLQTFPGLDIERRAVGGIGLGLLVDRGLDRLDRPVPRQRLIDGAAGLGIDPRLQFPALAARRQFGDQREQIVAIVLVRAGQKGQPAIVLDDAVVVLGKPQLAERIVQRAARGDQKHRHVQTAASFRRFVLGHVVLNPSATGYRSPSPAPGDAPGQSSRLSPQRLSRMSR